ncbi:MAG TPA: SCO family protein [Gemmatimonadaceae bacterium]|nr:SCO family protein [Gemmatimonadaceae bacterium]
MRTLPRVLLAGALLLVLTACDRGTAAERDANARRVAETGLYGHRLDSARVVPAVTLVDLHGTSHDLAQLTRGKLSLLFFGYTNCPDVCPVHMTNIAAAMRAFSWARRDSIRVIFVTTDPQRDTTERLREWIGSIDSTFLALRGSQAALDSAQRGLGLAEAMRLPGVHEGDYQVGHAGQVLAVFPDGTVRYAYPFGIRQAEWVHDLPKLLAYAAAGDAPASREG